ncbi:MAG: DUF5664 domain-containing protein [Nitrososphaera sp.]|nr:DUF5664 domain-containing protein [Nitrososphaera sp.]
MIAYFPRALKEIAKVSAHGAIKYGISLSDKDFLKPDYTVDGYLDAVSRHILDLEIEGEINHKDGGIYHRAQIAWNALASFEMFLVEQEKENGRV